MKAQRGSGGIALLFSITSALDRADVMQVNCLQVLRQQFGKYYLSNASYILCQYHLSLLDHCRKLVFMW